MTYCGGCSGEGRHRRWCPNVVGPKAMILGESAERAEELGDRIGANDVRGANSAYALAGYLRDQARTHGALYMEAHHTHH